LIAGRAAEPIDEQIDATASQDIAGWLSIG
jgi:hypothetical protein